MCTGSQSIAYVLVYSFLLCCRSILLYMSSLKACFLPMVSSLLTYGFLVITIIVSKWYLHWFCRWKSSTLFRGKCCCCIMCRSRNKYCNKSTLGCEDKISGNNSCRKLFWHASLDNWLINRYFKISWGYISLMMKQRVLHSLNNSF
jgi:hypothetical protein